MLDLAIVGGGPGGLMTAWYLRKKLGPLCKVTIFEATERVGGKILSKKFESAPALYEAGVAEIYDYSMLGPDPLRDLVQHLGLQTIPMDAEQVQLDGEVLDDVRGMRRKYGNATADAIEAFRKRCTQMISPQEYYEGVGSARQRAPLGLHQLRGTARPRGEGSGRQALHQGDGALRPRHRKPQHQRPQRAEELRDGYRRLYRPLFHPERQRADHRAAARGDRRRHPVQSSRAEGRQERRAAATAST